MLVRQLNFYRPLGSCVCDEMPKWYSPTHTRTLTFSHDWTIIIIWSSKSSHRRSSNVCDSAGKVGHINTPTKAQAWTAYN